MLALLVDAHRDTRALYAEFLRFAEWQIDEAEDGREALAKAIAGRPDLIVTELRLPGMSGLDLCRIVREDPLTATAKLVVVTSDPFPSDIERARKVGADAVLIKPCALNELEQTVTDLFEHSRTVARRAKQAVVELQDNVLRSREMLDASRRVLRHQVRSRDESLLAMPPATLPCPRCDRFLQFVRSYTGGVARAERWDYYECPGGCGPFQYRVRTRKLKSAL